MSEQTPQSKSIAYDRSLSMPSSSFPLVRDKERAWNPAQVSSHTPSPYSYTSHKKHREPISRKHLTISETETDESLGPGPLFLFSLNFPAGAQGDKS